MQCSVASQNLFGFRARRDVTILLHCTGSARVVAALRLATVVSTSRFQEHFVRLLHHVLRTAK